jgi:hypothetical protein
MIPVYLAADIAEAQLLRDRLTERGISAMVRNTHLQGALGELPLSVRPEVCVFDQRDYESARDCVKQMELAQKQITGPDVSCPTCKEMNPGNFEVCWSCGKDLPLSE